MAVIRALQKVHVVLEFFPYTTLFRSLSDLFSGFSLFKRPLQKGVKAGDTITLEISSKELFFRASQLYLMPLLALFVGAYLSNLIFPSNDIVQTLVGLSSLAASLVLLRFLIR